MQKKLLIIISILIITTSSVWSGHVNNSSQLMDNYKLEGDQYGRVTVREQNTDRIINVLKMPAGVIRETFLLPKNIIGAAQQNLTVFWNLETGEIVKELTERVYAFSPDQTRFVTGNSSSVRVHDFANSKVICDFKIESSIGGVEGAIISPDNHYLVVLFSGGRPANDANFPNPNPVRRNVITHKLFTLNTCEEKRELDRYQLSQLGRFTPDSQFYLMTNTVIFIDDSWEEGDWQLNLNQNRFEPVPIIP